MNRTHIMMTAAAAFVMMILAPLPFSDGSGADDVPTQWCYGDTVTFAYGIQGLENEVEVQWELSERSDFSTILASATGAQYTYTASPERGEIYVRQTVTYGDAVDVAVMKVILMHIGDDVYRVVFNADNGSDPVIRYIDRHTAVRSGSPFVELPGSPAKDGCSFSGWYTSNGERFDPHVPITSDVELHAKWTVSGSPDNGTDWMMILLVVFVVLVTAVLCLFVIKRDSRN